MPRRSRRSRAIVGGILVSNAFNRANVRLSGRQVCAAVRRSGLLWGLVFAAAACGPATDSRQPVPASATEFEFQGSWNGVGRRHSIPLGEGRLGSIVNLKGTLLLTGAGRPGVGFQSEVIGLTDTATGFHGRSVWTDEKGDQVYSELQGEGTATKNRITGTILSGTGRYAGATGSYEFSWEWVMEGEDGAVQGRAADLRGRVRPGTARQQSPR
jgi:hypothetical protein